MVFNGISSTYFCITTPSSGHSNYLHYSSVVSIDTFNTTIEENYKNIVELVLINDQKKRYLEIRI